MGCRTRRTLTARLRPCALTRVPCVAAAGGNGLDVGRRRAVEHRTVRVDHKLLALLAEDRAGTHRGIAAGSRPGRSEEQTSELQSLMRSSYAVFVLKKTK